MLITIDNEDELDFALALIRIHIVTTDELSFTIKRTRGIDEYENENYRKGFRDAYENLINNKEHDYIGCKSYKEGFRDAYGFGMKESEYYTEIRPEDSQKEIKVKRLWQEEEDNNLANNSKYK